MTTAQKALGPYWVNAQGQLCKDHATGHFVVYAEAARDALNELVAALGALNAEGCIDAKRCVYAVPGLPEYEAARLSGREGWEAALNHVARRCRAALAKVGEA